MIRIINGQCEFVLKTIGNDEAQVAFCDPPYNVGKKYDGYSDNLSPLQYENLMVQVISELTRISSRGIIFYVSGELTRKFMNLLPNAHQIIVVKRAVGVRSGGYVLQYHSILSTAKPIVKCPDVWDDVRLPGEGFYFREKRYDNPGLTSLELTKKVLYHFTGHGYTVIDPFIGTGTTAVAAKGMGRHCIGVEQSKKYCEIAERRLAETYQQLTAF